MQLMGAVRPSDLAWGAVLGCALVALVSGAAWRDPEIWREDDPAYGSEGLPPPGDRARWRRWGALLVAGSWRGLVVMLALVVDDPANVRSAGFSGVWQQVFAVTVTANLVLALAWHLALQGLLRPRALMVPSLADAPVNWGLLWRRSLGRELSGTVLAALLGLGAATILS